MSSLSLVICTLQFSHLDVFGVVLGTESGHVKKSSISWCLISTQELFWGPRGSPILVLTTGNSLDISLWRGICAVIPMSNDEITVMNWSGSQRHFRTAHIALSKALLGFRILKKRGFLCCSLAIYCSFQAQKMCHLFCLRNRSHTGIQLETESG